MAGRKKKGNVVLIEAFVVLCLLFMMQYVIAGASESSSEGAGDVVFAVDISQIRASVDNGAYHLDYVQVGDVMIDMVDGKGNCPSSGYLPWQYAYQAGPPPLFGRPGETILVEGKSIPNDFRVSDPADFELAQTALSQDGITIAQYPGQAGSNLSLAGVMKSDSENVKIAIYLCVCKADLNQMAADTLLARPHPVMITTRIAKGRSQSTLRYEADNHKSDKKDVPLDGYLYADAERTLPIATEFPIRRFELVLKADLSVQSQGLTFLPVEENAL